MLFLEKSHVTKKIVDRVNNKGTATKKNLNSNHRFVVEANYII